MKVAIVGGGFTGLAAGVTLVENGTEVVIYEASKQVGGLASGFRPKNWKWGLEKYYHHIFANDKEIMQMATQIGWPAYLVDPKTKTWRDGVEAELDSPIALLKYKQLSWWGRLRMAAGLAILKIVMWPSIGVLFERYLVVEMLPVLVGKEGYEKVWRPMMKAKFGKEMKKVNMAWFWARVFKRTKKLGYFRGGFEKLAEKMADYIVKKKGVIKLGTAVNKIVRKGEKWSVDGEIFDHVILTVPAPLIEKMTSKVLNWPKLSYLWGQTLILEMNSSFMDSYWLNILEEDWPFLVVVEHTRLIDRKNYGNKHVLYVGNYLADGDKRLKMSEKELLDVFMDKLKEINPRFGKKMVNRMWKFQAPFAQPVFPVGYSKMLPKWETSKDGLWLANMSMVYPWDRGTNYAVDLGVKTAKRVLADRVSRD